MLSQRWNHFLVCSASDETHSAYAQAAISILCSLYSILCSMSHFFVPCLPSSVPCLTSLFLSPVLCSQSYVSVPCLPFSFPNLKGTQAWDNLDFFLPKSNPYMPFVNCRKKFRFFFFDFRQNFDLRTFPRWLSIRGRDNQKVFCSKSILWSY